MQVLEKIFTPVSLLIINVAIILAVEFTGGGLYFHDSGWIHGIAVLFILLAFSRMFSRYNLKDPVLRRLLSLSLIALFILATPHFFEFLNIKIFGEYGDQNFASMINIYLAGILMIIGGTEYVLHTAQKRPHPFGKYAIALSVLFICLGAFSLSQRNSDLFSLAVNSTASYLYLLGVLIVGVVSIVDLREIKKSLPPLENFSRRMMWAIMFVAAAAVINALHKVLSDVLGMPGVQIIYISHFIFYASVSLMFLALGKIKETGVYADIQKMS